MNIQQWLDSGRDYETGRELYEQFGPNKSLKKTFGRGDNKWNRDKLAYELGKLRDKEGHVGDAEPVVLAGPIPEVNERMSDGVNDESGAAVTLSGVEGCAPVVDGLLEEAKQRNVPLTSLEPVHGEPIAILEMEVEWRAKYKRAATLQQQLHQAPTEAERAALCAEIVSIFEYGIDPLWEKLDEYKRTGKLPDTPAPNPTPKGGGKALDEMTPVELVSRRNNLRSRISKQKDNAKRQKDVDAWRKELSEVEALLNPETPKGE